MAASAGVDPLSDMYETTDAPGQDIVQLLIYEYLINNCHGETARAFGDACHLTETMTKDFGMDIDDSKSETFMDVDKSTQHKNTLAVALDTLSARKSLKYLILEGKLSEAVEFFDEHFVDSLETEKEILFALKCQLFIELIKTDTAQALEFAQKDLGQFANVSQKTDDLLQDVLSLIAYPDPQQSPVAHLLTQERREQVADEVNEYIIRSFGLSQQTCVEKIARQATVVRSALHSETSKDKKGPNQKIVYPKWSLDLFAK